MPYLDVFSSELTKEQHTLVQMGTIKSSKSHALVTTQGTKDQKDNGKQNKKQKNQGDNASDVSLSSSIVDTNSSSNQGKPKEKVKSDYCKKLGHDEHKCMKKQVDHLTHLLEKSNKGVTDLHFHQTNNLLRKRKKS